MAKLRAARKILHAERHDYPFTSVDPEDGGNYYLYNVGQKQFFCGGAKWGAHAALGWPGIEVTLELKNASENRYAINTHLNNGGTSQYLNTADFCDTGNTDGWMFKKIGGYYVIGASDENWILGFNPSFTADGNIYYAAVSNLNSVSEDNPNFQWLLVTKAQRDALLEEATETNPIDASHLIKMPNFSQREYVVSGTDLWNNVNNGGAWTVTNGSIWGRGGDHEDFALEAYNQSTLSVGQTISNLPPGKYKMTLNGYYRDRGHSAYYTFLNGEGTPSTHAKLYVNTTEVATLPAIERGVNMAPGLGTTVNGYGEVPDNPDQATKFFQNGCYKVESSVFEIGTDGTLTFEVKKDTKPNENDWVVVDNFRLVYLGGTLAIADNTAPSSARVDLTGSWNKNKFAEIDNQYHPLVYSIASVTGIGTGNEVTTTNPNTLFIGTDNVAFDKNTIKYGSPNYIAVTPIEFTDGYELNTSTLYNFTANQGVTYTRPNVKMQNYSTVVVPFDAPVPDGFTAFGIGTETKNDEFFITFTTASTLEAGKPYLLRPTTPAETQQPMTIAVSGSGKAVAFGLDSSKEYARGTYTFLTRPSDKNYYGVSSSPASNDHIKLAKLSATGRVAPFRIYFEVPVDGDGNEAKINMAFEEATGIRQATTEEIGRLFDIYSINGQMVKKSSDSTLGLPAGVYIVNGKKVVIK